MVTPSLTTNDAGYARNPLSPEGLRRFGAICGVRLPRRWLGHRQCQAALHVAPTRRNQARHTFTTACSGVGFTLLCCSRSALNRRTSAPGTR